MPFERSLRWKDVKILHCKPEVHKGTETDLGKDGLCVCVCEVGASLNDYTRKEGRIHYITWYAFRLK
jgi:hypothetical protein